MCGTDNEGLPTGDETIDDIGGFKYRAALWSRIAAIICFHNYVVKTIIIKRMWSNNEPKIISVGMLTVKYSFW